MSGPKTGRRPEQGNNLNTGTKKETRGKPQRKREELLLISYRKRWGNHGMTITVLSERKHRNIGEGNDLVERDQGTGHH